MVRRRILLAGSAGMLAAPALIGTAAAQAQWSPNRPITFVVPWGAGGGTDATARFVAAALEKELGQPVNVVNRTGGSGVVGHSAIATAPADGFTIGMITVEIGMMHWQGLTELKGTSYTPLALMNSDPPGVQVKGDSPFQNVKALADAIKANPGRMTASGTGQGGIWHLALAGWLRAMGLPGDAVRWVPSNGAAPAMQDLAAGGVDIVTCSVPEARAMIEANRAKSLAIMAPARNPQFPTVPTLNEELGINYTVAAWRGIAGPRNLPAPVVARIVPLLEKIWNSNDFKTFMNARGFGMTWAGPADFAKHMADDDKQMGEVMKAVGLAKA
ncbi:tripartite tricarboxylate transporter substrate binding protein [Elioraea sp.]|uniref:tripartite tricarboxylate transporter substrate binding protein n=1 Tax=Elioraea sp. TaxID=2185103 RepID=UPI0025BE3663|nr:tripartite tricarboxylate transporter substrate binding protein [Elioraea sp.]